MQDFQAFTVKYNGRTNVLFSKVGVSEAFNPKDLIANPPKMIEANAIWDTGASCTVITKQFAEQIGLIPTGKIQIRGVNHITEENTYLANFYLPNQVCMGFVRIAEVPALSGGAGILIGMDIIGSGDFSVYTEEGKTIMTFRLPSVGGVDFVEEAGNIKSHRAVMQKIEEEREKRRPPTQKEIQKRKQKRKNKKKHKRRH